MVQILYCWRCRQDMPMLDEEEWQEIAPLMTFETQAKALDQYRGLTGVPETNFSALWHHRVSLYGPPCQACGKALRTPNAKWCAACGEAIGNRHAPAGATESAE